MLYDQGLNLVLSWAPTQNPAKTRRMHHYHPRYMPSRGPVYGSEHGSQQSMNYVLRLRLNLGSVSSTSPSALFRTRSKSRRTHHYNRRYMPSWWPEHDSQQIFKHVLRPWLNLGSVPSSRLSIHSDFRLCTSAYPFPVFGTCPVTVPYMALNTVINIGHSMHNNMC